MKEAATRPLCGSVQGHPLASDPVNYKCPFNRNYLIAYNCSTDGLVRKQRGPRLASLKSALTELRPLAQKETS